MAPIRLTDSQLDAVLAATRPLAVADRDAFLQDVAAALQGRPSLEMATLYRAIADVQRRHHDPPQMDHDVGTGRRCAGGDP
jgi:hypothetical protein